MKLERFDKNKKYKKIALSITLLVIGFISGIFLFNSFAYFELTKSFNIIEGKVPTINKGDIKFAVVVGGENVDTIPGRNDGYAYVKSTCNNDATVIWETDNNKWGPYVSNLTKKNTTCTLYFEIDDGSLNGAEPVIKEDLVPVVIADDGTVTRADIRNEWYSYENSRWANAVILDKDKTNNKTFNVGDTIEEEYIESYFVWIPKYRYKLFNVEGNTISRQEIEIQFGDYDTVDNDTECVATNISGDNGTCENDKWMTHPAFTSLGVTGLWVGKFETGYKGSTDTESAEKNENAPNKVQIKPNVNSWRSINVNNAYNTSYGYKRTSDSHMMKNTEWGAMLYLTNSKYGRGNTDVWTNDNAQYVTGCSTEENPSEYNKCENAYNTDTGYFASTTNNITGIYDTVKTGGNFEYVMGNCSGSQGNSEFNSWSATKYYDKYISGKSILGDAMSETLYWSENFSAWGSASNPWVYVLAVKCLHFLMIHY